jgi:hypothetical protein
MSAQNTVKKMKEFKQLEKELINYKQKFIKNKKNKTIKNFCKGALKLKSVKKMQNMFMPKNLTKKQKNKYVKEFERGYFLACNKNKFNT